MNKVQQTDRGPRHREVAGDKKRRRSTHDLVMFEDKQIPTPIEPKFLGLFIRNTLSWKSYTEYIKAKLSSACYAMWSAKIYVSLSILKMIYYSYYYYVWFIVLGALLRQYKDFQVGKQDF